jgi:hypothetical protein
MQTLRREPPDTVVVNGQPAQVIDVVRSYFEQQVSRGKSPLSIGELVAIDFSRALSETIASHLDRQAEPEAGRIEAIMRGATAREEMLHAHGGAVTAARAAEILEVSKTRIHARYNAGSLIGVRRAKQNSILFPLWQFELKERRVKPLIEQVLKIFRDVPIDDWGRMDFFLNRRDELKGKCPLDLIETQPKRVLDLARQYAS